MTELGYNVVWESTNMLIAPPKLPKDIADTLAKAFETAANDPEYVKFLSGLNAVPTYLPPDKVNSYLDERRGVVRNDRSADRRPRRLFSGCVILRHRWGSRCRRHGRRLGKVAK